MKEQKVATTDGGKQDQFQKLDKPVDKAEKPSFLTKGFTSDQRHHVLLRQVQSKLQQEANLTKGDSVRFGKLISLADGSEKIKLYTGWFFAALTGATLPTFFFFIGPVFDSFGGDNDLDETRSKVHEVCLIMLGLAVFIFITSFFQNAMLMSASASIGAKLKTQYLKAVLNQESAWYDQSNYLEMSSRLDKEVETIKAGIGQKYGQVLYSIFMCLSGFFVGFYKGWSLAFAMLAIAPIMLIGMAVFGAVMQSKTIKGMRAYGQSAGYAEQALSAIRIVVSFGQEELEIKNYNMFLSRVTEAGKSTGASVGLSQGFFFMCIYFCYAYAFAMGGIWVDEKFWNHAEDRTYLAGDCLAVFFGILFGLFSLGGAGPNITAVNVAKAAGKAAFDVIDRVPAIDQDDKSVGNHQIVGEVEFKNVTFFYPSRPDAPVMNNLSVKFALGQTTAIVGPSGSGKSTTVQLTERFYDPNEGQVLIDGKDLKLINLRNFRQQIGYVGQEPVLFNTTVKKNILMGKPDATDAEIEEALRKTNAWDFVSAYPDGMNTNVGAGGGQLSGGQKQRIALARAFIKKPRLLIFDEATSALDKRNEAEVQKAIDQMKKELGTVTTLVIAHRLSTVQAADRIIVMKKGQVAEDGNHESLLRDYPTGIYAKLAKDSQKADEEEKKKEAAKAASAAEAGIDLSQLHPDLLKATKGNTQERRRQSVAMTEAVATADPVSQKQFAIANEALDKYNETVKADMNDILDVKKSEKTFSKHLDQYAFPKSSYILAIVSVSLTSSLAPLYGYFMMGVMSDMNKTAFENATKSKQGLEEENVLDVVLPWVLYMVITAVILGLTTTLSVLFMSKVSMNIVGGMRQELYENVMRKDIGWHDNRENGSGIITATLASDVQLLDGVSAKGTQTKFEGGMAVLAALIMAFIFSWPMALCGIGILPFILVCGAIAQKADQENMLGMEDAQGSDDLEHTDDAKQSKILAADSIANYKTVASFGHDQILIDEFKAINMRSAASDQKAAKLYALSLGLSVAINNGIFGLLYLAAAELYIAFPDYEYTQFDKMFIAMFVWIFGAFTAAQATAMGPDIGQSKKAAMKIFQYLRTPSKVDVLAPENAAKKSITKTSFNGNIEFKDVWFRYPTRLEQWIFKGLNLKINKDEIVAVVGESGQGKSTFINMVMRFYDPEFGQVLIDGVDVREYNVRDLRERLGLVMQEPLLFNYSLQENILYGKVQSSNEEIYQAAKVANALEFIESKDLSTAFNDDSFSLMNAMLSEEFKRVIIGELGQKDFDGVIAQLTALSLKDKSNAVYEEVANMVDTRDEATRKSLTLHEGFSVFAGNRGSKLSGGQKQRIAIARAVIRDPSILLLDEATSALDEESQRLVQEALSKIMVGRTSIVVAHRLTTVKNCTRLAVIDDGKIVEEGSFDELTAKENGHFASMAQGMRKVEKKEAKRLSMLSAGM